MKNTINKMEKTIERLKNTSELNGCVSSDINKIISVLENTFISSAISDISRTTYFSVVAKEDVEKFTQDEIDMVGIYLGEHDKFAKDGDIIIGFTFHRAITNDGEGVFITADMISGDEIIPMTLI